MEPSAQTGGKKVEEDLDIMTIGYTTSLYIYPLNYIMFL